MELFAQMNVFARIRTIFTWIRTIFAHLIISCAIRYPKIGNLRYTVQTYNILYTVWLQIL